MFNDTRVLPARFMLQKETGGLVEALFLSQPAPDRWTVLLKNVGRAAAPLRFVEVPEVTATVVVTREQGEHEIELSRPLAAVELLDRIGRMPLPPYIRRDKCYDARDTADHAW